MRNFAKTSYKKYLLAGATVLAMGAAPMVAHATPYAFASNQISGLVFSSTGATFTNVGGGETVSDSAQFGSYGINGTQGSGNVDAAVTIGQAYSGPGPAPTASYTPVGAGNFTGARSDASIGSGPPSTVNNVAEGYGNLLGNSTANNSATINFSVTGAGAPLTLSGSDLYQLIATTAASTGAKETANAYVQDTLSISGGGNTGYFSPFGTSGKASASSSNSVGTGSTGPTTVSLAYTTPFSLALGTTYTVSLVSQASESITPGSTTPVPEPGSLALLGTGLLGLALVSRKRIKKS